MNNCCPECGFNFDTPITEQVRIVAHLPDDATHLVGLARVGPYGRPSPGTWSANEYVWHLADIIRMFAEWLHKVRTQHHPTHVAPDPDGLAAARGYQALPLETGLWSLRSSCALFVQEAALADVDRSFTYKDWKDCTVAEVTGFAAHEAVHHMTDLHRGLMGTSASA